MNFDNLTPEDLQKLIKELDENITTRLINLFKQFAKEIATLGLVKSYLSVKQQKLLSEMKKQISFL